MVKIHGAVHMLLGLGIFAYTKFIESKAGTEVPVFFWIAIGFMVWGAFRISMDYIVREKKEKPSPVGPPQRQPMQAPHDRVHHKSPYSSHAHAARSHRHVQSHQHVRPTSNYASHPAHDQTHRRCPRCHQVNLATARMCSNCGYKLF